MHGLVRGVHHGCNGCATALIEAVAYQAYLVCDVPDKGTGLGIPDTKNIWGEALCSPLILYENQSQEA